VCEVSLPLVELAGRLRSRPVERVLEDFDAVAGSPALRQFGDVVVGARVDQLTQDALYLRIVLAVGCQSHHFPSPLNIR